jgi:sulfite oxidase
VNAKKEATRKRLTEFNEHGEGFTPITRPTRFVTMTTEEYKKLTADMEPRDVDE